MEQDTRMRMSYWEQIKRSSWAYPTIILSFYGFFANFRPAEPFLTPYLIGPYKNISEEQVTNYLFPIWTYSYLAVLCPVFLLTDFLLYKPVIVVQGLFLVTNYVLLCFAQGLAAMTFLQINYAVVTATEVAYFSYIYSVVPVDQYQRVTGYLRGAMLVGFTLGAALGQVLVSVVGLSYFYINAINLGTLCVAFALSFCLPMPQHGLFFRDQSHSAQQGETRIEAGGGWCSRTIFRQAGQLLWKSFRDSYSSRQLIYWALWWALATAGYFQVFNYIQLMWNHIEPSSTSSVYNGGVEAITALMGAAVAFSVGHVRLRWAVWGELVLGVFSAVSAGAVFLMGLTSNIWACYAGYITFKASYMLMITIAMFQIAGNLSIECYALTFGINTFVAVLLQTLLTAIVVDDSGLGLDIVTQFIIYGSYYAAISLLFLVRGAYTAGRHHCGTGQASVQDQKEDPGAEVLSSVQF
ncbi:hypothetical protein AAFF_G00441230 [Aldrovandia affinis]|uniref:Uncharacterized protein n=1 Tax=Aldrovandia affinis TaxID=143900 RepID=A0AAD7WII3_9TELE|nr:hypothetical protein AAFF_G00441230 [Aldrovandia affinis]